MDKKKSRFERLMVRLKNRYRLVVMNDDTFEEKFSLRLTPLGLVILISAVSIFMTVLVISIVAFTPLRQYIPGYGSDVNMKNKLIALTAKTDSIENELEKKSIFLENIQHVLRGDITVDSLLNKPDSSLRYTKLNFKPSAEDSALRNQMEQQDQYSLSDEKGNKNAITSFFFFTPVKGEVTNSFNQGAEHFGVDIAAPENEAIKAALEGTIIFTGWSAETGYVIQIQHSNNLISVYKHNSKLMKKMGQYVKAGEVIAIIGNSGEQTTGTHLHFELWHNGNAIDPQEYMVF